MDAHNNTHRIGFFAIIGKPNAGKSSILNAIVGQKISIVSYKPQTTRNKISGIYTKDDCQLVFLDTPGFIKPDNLLSDYMAKEIKNATTAVDGTIFVVDCNKPFDSKLSQTLGTYNSKSLIVAINKTDLEGFESVYPLIDKIKNIAPDANIIPLSAKNGQNIELLISSCIDLSKVGNKHYDDNQITDKTMRFVASEIIREKILLFYEDEIPHGISVYISEYTEKPKCTVIHADIICNKESHKPILIGSNGDGIKRIGEAARKDIESNLDVRVYLQLFVKVRKDWKSDINYINDFGYKS